MFKLLFFVIINTLIGMSALADPDTNASEAEYSLPDDYDNGFLAGCMKRAGSNATNEDRANCLQEARSHHNAEHVEGGDGIDDTASLRPAEAPNEPALGGATVTNQGQPQSSGPIQRSPTPVLDEQEVRIAALDSAFQKCEEELEQTDKCCTNPMACLVGTDSKSASGVSLLLQAAAGTVTNMASISGACGTIGDVSKSVAALNAALAFKCSNKIGSCNKACKRVYETAKDIDSKTRGKREVNTTCTSGMSCTREDRAAEADILAGYDRRVSDVRSRAREISQAANRCDDFGGHAVEQQTAALSSLYAAKIAGLCKKQTQQLDPANVAQNDAFNVNCADPANAANPVCQNQCNRANAANDPVCARLLGLNGSGFGNGQQQNKLFDPAAGSKGLDGLDEFEDSQLAADANIQAQANKGLGSGGAGGGGGPGSAPASTGSDPDGGGEGGGGSGIKTDILTGVKSGGGYTQPFVRSGIGGGGGYSGPSGAPARGLASDKGKPFNPKDFLPGGRLDPKRKLAGLASAIPDIGAVHGDIFKNVTNRFLQVCLRDALFDCETLRKNARPKN